MGRPGIRKIKHDLLDQLEEKGIRGDYTEDLVKDYMAFWEIKNKLIEDIEEKGVSIRWQNGENQFGYKKNDSIAELNKVSTQMLKILDHLGLKPSKHEKEPEIPEM
ncbi:MAG: phage terminase small subunit [Candidatus Frackibacter sp. T328-2]|nr:MAG: phage terminase small subunit [Candidatus Frackibacter sp. T328-2]